MRRALAHALLVAGLALAAPAPAQFRAPSPALEADAHVFSAFTTRTDPRVLAEKVTLGPALREQLGSETDFRKIYDALVASVADKPLTSRTLSVGEAVGYASLGVNAVDPLVLVEAGDVRLLMQYSSAEKHVVFVEQLAGPAVTAPTPPQAAKPEPIVEKALPTEPPPAIAAPPPPPAPIVAAPAAAAVPKPTPQVAKATPKPRAPVAAVAPAAAKPAAAPKPAPKRAEKPRPRGECVIKPVMSEDDLWNCSAPGLASSPQIETPAPAVTATSAFASQTADRPQAECVIKPVMTEQEMKVCAAASKSRPSTPVEVAAPVAAAKPAAPPAELQPAPAPECVIKPVMTEAEMKVCATASRSRLSTPAPVEPSAPAVAAMTSGPALQEPPQPRECVIKPVMSEEDLRICAAAPRSPQGAPAEATAAVTASVKPAAAAPAAPAEPRECVIKAVMSEEDLRACGARR